MTAIQMLEKFGADASFMPENVSDAEREKFNTLVSQQPGFHAPLLTPAEDEGEEDSTGQETDDESATN